MKIIKYTVPIFLFFIFNFSSIFGNDVVPDGTDRFIADEITLGSSAAAGEKINIRATSGLSGKIKISANDADTVVLECRKIAKTSTRAKAAEYTELTDVTIRKARKGLEILFRTPNPAPWSGTDESVFIEGELYLPKDCQLELAADYFDLEIEGPFVSVENRKSFGRLDVSNITKIVDLTGSNRDISLKNIRGDITVNLSHADIWIEDMKAEYRAARINNEYGNISIDRFGGDFIVNNSYGKIKLTNMDIVNGKSRIEGTQCPIRVTVGSFDNAELFISNSYEDIILELPDTVAAGFFLKTEDDGAIHIQGIPVKPILIESNYVELKSGDGGSKIKIGADGGGNINIFGYSEK